jgi:hypothetical protein
LRQHEQNDLFPDQAPDRTGTASKSSTEGVNVQTVTAWVFAGENTEFLPLDVLLDVAEDTLDALLVELVILVKQDHVAQ